MHIRYKIAQFLLKCVMCNIDLYYLCTRWEEL